jgi:hypothetical protein
VESHESIFGGVPIYINNLFKNACQGSWTQEAGGVAQVVECLPSQLEVLSSNPNIAKKKKKSRAYTKCGELLVPI